MTIFLIHQLDGGVLAYITETDARGHLPQPLVTRMCSYAIGLKEPMFPVPATRENAETANAWMFLVLCHTYQDGSVCLMCIDQYMDQLISDQWTECHGLMGECFNCIWPNCEVFRHG